MDRDDPKKLIDRVEKLETLLSDLNIRIGHLSKRVRDAQYSSTGHRDSFPPDSAPEAFQLPSSPLITFDDDNLEVPQSVDPDKGIQGSELWLNRIGTTLLLVGMGFLFKYSIDQNWITPWVRIVFGLGLGVGLISLGIHFQKSGTTSNPFIFTGGMAAIYIAGFAAFGLYHLIPQNLALAYMTGATLLAFTLAVRQKNAALSLVAVLGGLGTPFLLLTGSGNIPGGILYTCLVLSAAMTVFYFRPWSSLLWSSWAGGWIVLGKIISHIHESHPESFLHSWSAQAGLLFLCALYWTVPLLQKGDDWLATSKTDDADATSQVFANLADDCNNSSALMVVLSPIFMFAFSRSIWILSDAQWGVYLSGGALIFFLTSGFQWQIKARREMVALHASVATLLLTLALYYLLDGNRLFLAYAMEAAALKAISHKIRQPAVGAAASMLFAGVGLWFVARQFENAQTNPVFNAHAAVDLAVILLATFSATRTRHPGLSPAYALFAYLGLLAWLLRELDPVANGTGLVSISWGVLGSLLIWTGIRRNQSTLFKTGFATTVLMAFKLLAVDLAHLDVIWRILIFLSFGATLLLINYWMKGQWKVDLSGTPNNSLDTSFKP